MGIYKAAEKDADSLADIIAKANRPVATALALTPENAPTHPSLCTPGWIRQGMDRGETYFAYHLEAGPVGCVAMEFPDENLAYLNRLAVLPAFQTRGIGSELVDWVIACSGEAGRKTVSIGIIAQHTSLRHWYEKKGFLSFEQKTIDHLPFDVLLMRYDLET